MYVRTRRSLRILGVAAIWALVGGSPAGATGWMSSDVGPVGARGGSTLNVKKDLYKVNGAGSGIESTADSFHYLYQTLPADGAIVVRLASLQKVDGWTQGGVMFRQTLAPDSVHASLLVTPSNGILFQRRTTAGGGTAQSGCTGVAPSWLRLTRTGTTIAAAVSTDGTAWKAVGSSTVPFSGAIYVGMAVSSNRPTRLASGGFASAKISSAAGAPPPPGTGLVAAWSFDEGRGPTVQDDLRTHPGTLDGAAWTTAGRFGNALFFDGAASLVTVKHHAALNLSAMTLEAWVRPATIASSLNVLAKEAVDGATYALYAAGGGATPLGFVSTAAADSAAVAPAMLPANAWSHVAATYDGATVRLFVNGAEVATAPASGALRSADGALRIGGNALWGEHFHGTIDNVRIYNRALGASEIKTNMGTPVPPAAPPPDTTAPLVAVTAPAAGAALSGVVTVTAAASDDVGVTSVQFLLGGAGLGPALGKAPYSVSWDTTGVPNGVYVLSAVARDAAGNTGSAAAVSVTVNNVVTPPNPRRVQFTSPDHLTVLPTGQAAVTSYTLEVWRAGANPAASEPQAATNIGKPSSSSTTVVTDQEAFLSSLPKGQQYFTTVTANGPGGSSRSAASALFTIY